MFIGHYGPAVWDTQRGHGVPLITLWQGFVAVQALDFTAGVLTLFGLEGTRMVNDAPFLHIPWSHSLWDFPYGTLLGRVTRLKYYCLAGHWRGGLRSQEGQSGPL